MLNNRTANIMEKSAEKELAHKFSSKVKEALLQRDNNR
jgi:hypothetical protein